MYVLCNLCQIAVKTGHLIWSFCTCADLVSCDCLIARWWLHQRVIQEKKTGKHLSLTKLGLVTLVGSTVVRGYHFIPPMSKCRVFSFKCPLVEIVDFWQGPLIAGQGQLWKLCITKQSFSEQQHVQVFHWFTCTCYNVLFQRLSQYPLQIGKVSALLDRCLHCGTNPCLRSVQWT